ncbi:unnamed protein product [Mytilus edulis]|uniref:Uncharacterized protein n=1 Tax=Mytilus edulis TaxID=6550 RepID=A0A8S3TII2_MYTED|nr:unnamed protein product [Mytilus edulis]
MGNKLLAPRYGSDSCKQFMRESVLYGGGTVDISAQEVLPDDCLNIIHRVRGGDYGGNSVNMAYRSMLVRLFSGPCIVTFKEKHRTDYMDMMRSFEERKKRHLSWRIPRAVIYGHMPKIVSSRVCNFTYSISVLRVLNQECHLRKKVIYDGRKCSCEDVFKIACADTVVSVGQKNTCIYNVL